MDNLHDSFILQFSLTLRHTGAALENFPCVVLDLTLPSEYEDRAGIS